MYISQLTQDLFHALEKAAGEPRPEHGLRDRTRDAGQAGIAALLVPMCSDLETSN